MTTSELIDDFLVFEKKYQMFNIELCECKIWHYIRFYVYTYLLSKFGISHSNFGQGVMKEPIEENLKTVIQNNIFQNQFLAHKRDVLIVSHPRKVKNGEGKNYRCVYTDLLDMEEKRPHYIWDRCNEAKQFLPQESHNIINFNYEQYKKWFHVREKEINIKKNEIEERIIKPIEDYFHISIEMHVKRDWTQCINNIVKRKETLERYYNYMLEKISPKVILIVVGYESFMMTLCEVAKRKRIPVIELQHGTMGREHIAYNFYGKMKLETFPDYIFTFGKYDKNTARFPIPRNKVFPIGYPELEYHVKKYGKNEIKNGKKKCILFISQGIEEIARYASKLSQELDVELYRIIFKLHPGEYASWRSTLGKYLVNTNIEVVDSSDKSIYYYLGMADWVVGSYSTVLFEATMFDVKIAVLKIASYTYTKILYENGYALLIENESELVREITADTFVANNDVKIFEINSLHRMLAGIEKVIGENKNKRRKKWIY